MARGVVATPPAERVVGAFERSSVAGSGRPPGPATRSALWNQQPSLTNAFTHRLLRSITNARMHRVRIEGRKEGTSNG